MAAQNRRQIFLFRFSTDEVLSLGCGRALVSSAGTVAATRQRDTSARLSFHRTQNRLQVIGCRLQGFRIDDPALLQFSID